jgi:hypothetical protein
VNRRNKPQEKLEVVLKDTIREILNENEQMVERWSDYFESLLNVDDDKRAKITSMSRGGVTSRNVGDHNVIEKQEVEEAVSKLKNGKASEEDGIASEKLKRGGPAVAEWLVCLFNLCMYVYGAPFEWRSAIIVRLFKGKGDKKECKNYRGISLLSTTGKVYGRVTMKSVWKKCKGVKCMEVYAWKSVRKMRLYDNVWCWR